MRDRKTMSKKTRFEVFKRDSFTCQYCGRKAPEVVLQVDHIEPVASGGSDALINLITSCESCNNGKGATPLSDSSAVEKQRRQLEELQERREQIDMMVEWQKGLQNVDDYATEQIAAHWADLIPGWTLNENGKKDLRKLLKKHGVDTVMKSMREAVECYIKTSGDPPVATKESVQEAWNRVGRIAGVAELYAEKPYMRDLFYIRGMLRNKFQYCDQPRAIELLTEAYEAGNSIEDLKKLARHHRNWTVWESEILDWIAEAKEDSE